MTGRELAHLLSHHTTFKASVLRDLLERCAHGNANDVRAHELLIGQAECINLGGC